MHFAADIFRWRPLRFLLSGGTAAVVNIGALYLLVDIGGMWYLPGAALAYTAAIGVSFLMQKFFTFGDYGTENLGRQSAQYAVFQLCNVGVNTAFVYVGVEFLRISHLVAQVISGGVIALYTFAVLQYVLFRPKPAARSSSPCPSCLGTAQAEWGEKNGYRLVRCKACGLIFVSPMPRDSAELYSEGYFSGGKEFGYVEYDRDKEPMRRTFETYLAHMEKTLGKKGRLLDIGCATGYFMEVARRSGWEAEGVDISEHASRVGRAKGLTIYTGAMPPKDLRDSYDAITLLDVIEHVQDPKAVIAQCGRLLREGGIIVVTTPDSGTIWARLLGPRWHLVVPPEHLVLFNRKNFVEMLARAGFEPRLVTTIAKSFTLPYIFQTLFHWQGFSLWNKLARFTDTRLGRAVSIPINLRDTFFIIAIKA